MRAMIPAIWAAFFLITGCSDSPKEILIPRSAVQKIADGKFPYEKNLIVASYKLHSPQVYFQNQYVGMRLQYAGNLLGKEVTGDVFLWGQIQYKPAEGAFYVTGFQVADVTTNRPDIVNKEQVKEVMTGLVGNYLKEYPVYRLNPDDYKQNFAKLFLKGVGVRGDNLVLTLGI